MPERRRLIEIPATPIVEPARMPSTFEQQEIHRLGLYLTQIVSVECLRFARDENRQDLFFLQLHTQPDPVRIGVTNLRWLWLGARFSSNLDCLAQPTLWLPHDRAIVFHLRRDRADLAIFANLAQLLQPTLASIRLSTLYGGVHRHFPTISTH